MSDIDQTEFVLNGGYVDGYGKIFKKSNEDIDAILDNFNIKGKEVLTVLGSGDQAFHFLDRGAKSIDTFDSNKLTIYYYYLRKWLIKYQNSYYPPMIITNIFIKKLLDKVEPQNESEEKALKYWKEFTDKSFNLNKLLNCYRTFSISNRIYNTDEIQKRIDEEIHYHCLDMAEDIKIDKKYDIIYTSNISDWLIIGGKSLRLYRDNLYNLLKDNGIVICSNVTRIGATCEERMIFNRKFSHYEELPNVFSLRSLLTSPGYIFNK